MNLPSIRKLSLHSHHNHWDIRYRRGNLNEILNSNG